jgi:hypothetical protein
MSDDENATVAYLLALIQLQRTTIDYMARRVDGQFAIIRQHEARLTALERRVAALGMIPIEIQFSDS